MDKKSKRRSYRKSLPGAVMVIGFLASIPAFAGGMETADRGNLQSTRGLLELYLVHNNVDATVEYAVDDIELSHGGMAGRVLFREYLSDPKYRRALAKALNLQGELLDQGNLYCTPAIICKPGNDEDPEPNSAYVIWPGRPCHEKPHIMAPTVERLVDQKIRLRSFSGVDGWYAITVNGNDCYASDDVIYPALGYRILLRKFATEWKIEAVLAGD